MSWTCADCGHRQGTPDLTWDQERYRLICGECAMMQIYNGYIGQTFDPRPPRHIRASKREAGYAA